MTDQVTGDERGGDIPVYAVPASAIRNRSTINANEVEVVLASRHHGAMLAAQGRIAELESLLAQDGQRLTAAARDAIEQHERAETAERQLAEARNWMFHKDDCRKVYWDDVDCRYKLGRSACTCGLDAFLNPQGESNG